MQKLALRHQTVALQNLAILLLLPMGPSLPTRMPLLQMRPIQRKKRSNRSC
jgi:hypothetical protein